MNKTVPATSGHCFFIHFTVRLTKIPTDLLASFYVLTLKQSLIRDSEFIYFPSLFMSVYT